MGQFTNRRRHAFAFFACLSAAGCTQSPSTGLVTTAAWGIKSIELSSGALVSGFDPATDHYEIDSLNTSGTVKIKVSTANNSIASLAGVAIPSDQWVPLPLPRMDKGMAIPLAVTDNHNHSHTYQLASLPADFPDYTATATTPASGIVCLTANASGGKSPSYLIITDQMGSPVFYRRLPEEGFNLQREVAPDGSTRYSYLQVEGPQLDGVSTGLGTVRLMDSGYNEIAKLSLLPYGDHGPLPADLHEFVYLDDNHYILLSSEGKTVSNIPSMPGKTSKVAATVIQEIQNGQVVFDWDSSAFPEFYTNASDGNDFTNAKTTYADYMHTNAISIDPKDNNLVVSLRHQDQVIKLDRKTGQILWRFGGKDSDFPLTDSQKFSHQHSVRMNADGTLTMFDNGDATLRTRLLTFTLDETNRTVKAFDSFEPETRYSFAMGSYQKLTPDTAFVGWGARTTGVSDATEYRQGLPTFSLSFTNPLYQSYRALKYLTN